MFILVGKMSIVGIFNSILIDFWVQTTISDLVQIPPHEFYKLSRDEVEDKINEKYSNKVSRSVAFPDPGSANF